MINNDATMKEKADVLRNDQRVREQGSTFLQHTHNEIGGRFAAVSSPRVIGETPSPASQYPAGPAWCADPGSQCVEPPLGFENPALNPSDLEPSPALATGDSTATPSPPVSSRSMSSEVGSPSSRTYRRR
jgi:hypothetical protein